MLEQRPIVAIAIGYIIGIIMGLYCKISIVLLYLYLCIIYYIFKKAKKPTNKFKLISFKRYFRYIKIIITKKVLIIIIVSSIVSNLITIYKNNDYKKTYERLNNKEIHGTAVVISNIKEKQYNKVYKIKTNKKNII